MTGETRKPDIVWLEGLLTLFEAKFPHEPNDPRRMGFDVGRQIVGLYITEMLLKYALEGTGRRHGNHHNLHELFRNLPRQQRKEVERKYEAILNSQFDWAWDVAESVDSLLRYCGENAITDTRYYWEPGRQHLAEHASILFSPRLLYPLVYALFIALHGYPTQPIVKRYNTIFRSLEESLKEDQMILDREKEG